MALTINRTPITPKPLVFNTVSGPIASCNNAKAGKAKQVLCSINPVQSGSGDPSPSNVRPTTGFTGLDLYRTGKNMLPKTPYQSQTVNGTTFTVNSDGSVTVSGTPSTQTRVNLASGTFLTAKQVEIFSSGTMPTGARFFCTRVRNGTTSYPTISPTATAQVGDTYSNLLLEVNTTFNGTAFTVYPMVEKGSTATTYEPYTGTTYPITWQTEAGTVYGGTVDLTTGKLTVTDANIASYNGEALPSTWISSMDVYSEGGTPTTGAQVVYKLETPIEYDLTPTQVQMLLGTNNLWCDTGDTSVTYMTN